MSSIYTVDKWG